MYLKDIFRRNKHTSQELIKFKMRRVPSLIQDWRLLSGRGAHGGPLHPQKRSICLEEI